MQVPSKRVFILKLIFVIAASAVGSYGLSTLLFHLAGSF